MNYFSVTSLAQDFLRAVFRIGTHNCRTTFTTTSLMQFVRISMAHTLSVSLVWMSRRDREVIFDIKDEFLFDNLERSLGYFTFDNTSEERIDIFLGCFVANYFFIVLFDWQWTIKRTNIRVFVFSIVPAKSSLLCFFFCQRQIIICD